MCRIPKGSWLGLVTTKVVILACSIFARAFIANSSGLMVRHLVVITLDIGVVRFTLLLMVRRRSPSVNMPASFALLSAIAVMPSP